jgi:hypothetical protein
LDGIPDPATQNPDMPMHLAEADMDSADMENVAEIDSFWDEVSGTWNKMYHKMTGIIQKAHDFADGIVKKIGGPSQNSQPQPEPQQTSDPQPDPSQGEGGADATQDPNAAQTQEADVDEEN